MTARDNVRKWMIADHKDELLDAYRAEVLREAADAVAELRDTTDVNVAEYPQYDFRQRVALSLAESRLRRMANTAVSGSTAGDEQPETCNCGHGKDRHAPDIYGTGTCADCPDGDERPWRHPYTPASQGGTR